MQCTTARDLWLFCSFFDRFIPVLALFFLACQEPPKAPSRAWTPEQIAWKKKKLGLVTAPPSTPEEDVVESAPEPYHPKPPWTTSNALLSELATTWPEEPRGTLSGELFGKNLPVLGMVRTLCGFGTVFQVVYQDPVQGILTTSPVLVQAVTFPKGVGFSYKEGGFVISGEVTEDSDARFQGHFSVISLRTRKPFWDVVYDGPVLDMLIPPVLPKGFPVSPTYAECYASGHFSVTTNAPTNNKAAGLLHARDARDDGSPVIRVPLTPRDTLRIHIHNPRPDNPMSLKSASSVRNLRRSRSSPRVLVDLIHIPEDEDAAQEDIAGPSMKGLLSAQTIPILEGTMWLETKLVDQDKKHPPAWHVAVSLAGLVMPDDIDSPLASATLKTLSIDAFLISPQEPRPMMPPRRELNP